MGWLVGLGWVGFSVGLGGVTVCGREVEGEEAGCPKITSMPKSLLVKYPGS